MNALVIQRICFPLTSDQMEILCNKTRASYSVWRILMNKKRKHSQGISLVWCLWTHRNQMLQSISVFKVLQEKWSKKPRAKKQRNIQTKKGIMKNYFPHTHTRRLVSTFTFPTSFFYTTCKHATVSYGGRCILPATFPLSSPTTSSSNKQLHFFFFFCNVASKRDSVNAVQFRHHQSPLAILCLFHTWRASKQHLLLLHPKII